MTSIDDDRGRARRRGRVGRHGSRLALVLSALAVVTAVATPASANSSGRVVRGVEPGETFTPLAAEVISRPPAVRGTDGAFHIAYELILTGATRFTVDVERVEIHDAKTDRVLLELSGDELASRMNPVASTPAAGGSGVESTVLAPSASAIVWLDVTVDRKSDVPATIEHLVGATTQPQAGEEPVEFETLVGRVALDPDAPVELGPPVRGGIWVAVEGCCDENTHHRRGLFPVGGTWTVFQRFAIDWMRLDRQHRAWVGDPARLSSYFSYGQPLIAVADGTVVFAADGFPNAAPPNNPTPPPVAELTGNHVTLRIGQGVYVTYAHMKPGSVRVSEGDRVRRGQQLGELGNSGNSATPHVHVQVEVSPSFLSDGLPFVFDRFRLLGRITSPFSDEDLGLRPDGQLTFAPSPEAGTRRLEMPLNLNVVRFP